MSGTQDIIRQLHLWEATKLPRTMKQHDSMMEMVYKLTKTTHFILVQTTHKEENIVDIYMKGTKCFFVYNRTNKFYSNLIV